MTPPETTRRPRIALITTVHPWNDTRIFLKQARSLAAAGHDVTLIAPHEADTVADGVRISALPAPGGRLSRMTAGVLRAFSRARGCDICHFHDPELIPAAILLKLAGRRVIYDVHENLPRQIEDKHWIPRPLRPVVSRFAAAAERLGAAAADRVVAATPSIAARFPKAKTVLVQNFPLPEELIAPQAVPMAQRPADFAYVGGLTEPRGAFEMVRAMADPALADSRLLIAGRCAPEGLEARLKALPGADRVEFLGHLGRAQVAELLGRVRAGLVTFHPAANHIEAQPNKLFEYMSAGLPVIASDFPLWRRIVDGDRVGLLADPRDPAAIAGAMRRILDAPGEAAEMGRRGREAVARTYNWSGEGERLLAMYRELAALA